MSTKDDPFRDVILEAERRAERLIGFLRIAVAISLAIVFNLVLGAGGPPDDDPMTIRFTGLRSSSSRRTVSRTESGGRRT